MRLLLGDATDNNLLPRESVDLIVTSPPYNLGKGYEETMSMSRYLVLTRAWADTCYGWTKDNGRMCVNLPLDVSVPEHWPLYAKTVNYFLSAGWHYRTTIIWDEGNISKRTAWGSWKSATAPNIIAPVEVILVLFKGNWKRSKPEEIQDDITADEFVKWTKGLWSFPGESAKRIGHEAPFPRELPKRCIKLFSFPGDTVLDPFAGSGTTLIEALANDRKAIGIEIEQRYIELALQRIDRYRSSS